MAVKSLPLSTLNPNAPLFFPAAFAATEDFSAEWWRLVHVSPAFREYWLRERFECVDDNELTVEDLEELDAVEEFTYLQLHLEEMERAEEVFHFPLLSVCEAEDLTTANDLTSVELIKPH
eukprot:Gb_25009 [translate_table: standard]